MATLVVSKEIDKAPSLIGKPIDRVDGRLLVTGSAQYTTDYDFENQAYGVIVQSTIASGRITTIDSKKAEKAPGVLGVITHDNAPKLVKPKVDAFKETWMMEDFIPLQDDTIYYAGQAIAAVVADTLEHALFAASFVKVTYDEKKPIIKTGDGMAGAYKPEVWIGFIPGMQLSRGDVKTALEKLQENGGTKVEQTYTTPVEYNNALEPHDAIAYWEGDRLTVYNGSQWVGAARTTLSLIFGVPRDNIRVISYYTGGAFGSKETVFAPEILAVVASRMLGRPVKFVLSRQQMFNSTGHRAATTQQILLAATKDGRLTATRHVVISQSSVVGTFFEPAVLFSPTLYSCPNLEVSTQAVPLNTSSPWFMRGPGESTGGFALESAMDELSYQLGIDPLELRMINYADANPQWGLPWSGKNLKECYELGAKQFGWSKRSREPRSMRDGGYLVGLGMATATYPGGRQPASARVRILPDGSAVVSSATHEMGGGTYTILAQIAADTLRLPIEKVKVEIGDTNMPFAPLSATSMTAASVGTAVKETSEALIKKIILAATNDASSPIHGAPPDNISVREGGRLSRQDDPGVSDSFTEIIRRNNLPNIEAEVFASPGEEAQKFSSQSFGSVFAEAKVDPEIGEVKVTRILGVYDVGRILNAKTAKSQMIGGIIWGIGQALMEFSAYDNIHGRVVTNNLADYLVPVNADVKQIDVAFIDKPDPYNGSLGVRGVGEIGIVGALG